MSDEKERREAAYAAETVMAAADRLGMSVQDFIRRSAVSGAKAVARSATAPGPVHTCGGFGCPWCDPLREHFVTMVWAAAS